MVARFGYLGTPEAEIASVKDVLNDQGGEGQALHLSAYDILRSAPSSAVAAARAHGARLVSLGMGVPLPGEIVVTRYAAQSYYWEFLASVLGTIPFPTFDSLMYEFRAAQEQQTHGRGWTFHEPPLPPLNSR